MSFDPLSTALDLGKIAIEKIWPDPTKRAKEVRKLEELHQQGDLEEMHAHVQLLVGQMNINMEEAKHKSIFVAGWRPWTGWVCGFSLAYVSILEPLMRFTALMFGWTGDFPAIDTTITMQVLMGMLGIAGMRSYDKEKRTQTDSI